MNLKIKYREGFRPFAPSVLKEDAEKYFKLPVQSPYMLLVFPINDAQKSLTPDNYENLSLWDKLYQNRSSIQAVTHVDFSARVQTVTEEINPKYFKLLTHFKNTTGCSVLVNTSFNVRGEPIVCSPTDAYRCFMSTDMDFLVMENFVYVKTEQPDYQDKAKWMKRFEKD